MVGIAAALAAGDAAGFNAAQFRDELDNGRKVAIQILEFFDRHGVVIRRGDLQAHQPAAARSFRPAARDADGGEASPVGRPDFKSGGAVRRSLVGSTHSFRQSAERGRP